MFDRTVSRFHAFKNHVDHDDKSDRNQLTVMFYGFIHELENVVLNISI